MYEYKTDDSITAYLNFSSQTLFKILSLFKAHNCELKLSNKYRNTLLLIINNTLI